MRIKVIIVSLVVLTCLSYLLIRGVLLSEKRISKNYTLSNDQQDSLVCTYLTLLGKSDVDYWYSSNDVLGKSKCPILQRL